MRAIPPVLLPWRVKRDSLVRGSHSLTVPSAELVARRLPSGESSSEFSAAVCPRRTRSGAPAAASQIRTAPSASPDATIFRSGESTIRVVISVMGVSRSTTGAPVAASQIRTVPSPPAVARRLPSGENAIVATYDRCPRSTRRGSPVAASHSTT